MSDSVVSEQQRQSHVLDWAHRVLSGGSEIYHVFSRADALILAMGKQGKVLLRMNIHLQRNTIVQSSVLQVVMRYLKERVHGRFGNFNHQIIRIVNKIISSVDINLLYKTIFTFTSSLPQGEMR